MKGVTWMKLGVNLGVALVKGHSQGRWLALARYAGAFASGQ